ncbi:MAG: hypothetical protein IT285_03215 [Bdellovibrionales bacterium]|nr:hypothetical protein [Bdellovibrionales bacterium]
MHAPHRRFSQPGLLALSGHALLTAALLWAPLAARSARAEDPLVSPWDTFWDSITWLTETYDPNILSDSPFYDLSPTLHVRAGIGTDRVNLTPAPASGELSVGQEEGGFRMRRFRRFEAGIGGALDLNFLETAGTSLPVPFVGLIPIAGVAAEDTMWMPNREAENHLGPVRAYPTREFILGLRPGDRLIRQMSGGVLFSVGIGFYMVGVSGRYLARGEWEVSVERLRGTEALVKVSRSKLHSLSLNAGAVVIGVAAENFRNADRYFSFKIDLESQYSGLVLHDIVRGNLTKAQELAAQPDSPVRLEVAASTVEKGGFQRFWYGIPAILGGEISRGKITSYSNEWRFSANGARAMVDHGVFLREQEIRLLARKQRHSRMFYTTYATVGTPDPSTEGGVEAWLDQDKSERDRPKPEDGVPELLGNFVWHYEDNRSKGGRLASIVRRLIADTGLERELAVRAPPEDEKLKYASVKFGFTFSTPATHRLMMAAQHPQFQVKTLDFLDRRLEDYFTLGDRFDLCDGGSLQRCQIEFRRETLEALGKMREALLTMARTRMSSKGGFVKAYAEFGKAMMENQFTFGVARDIVGSAPLRMRYEVEGERITRLIRNFGEYLPQPPGTLSKIGHKDRVPYRLLKDQEIAYAQD